MEALLCVQCGLPAKVKGFCKPHYKKEWATTNKDHLKAQNAAYYVANKEKRKEKSKAWYENNKKRALKAAALKIAKDRPKHNRYVAKWAKNNPAKRRAIWAKYNAAKLQATPSWADCAEIERIYLKCPPGHHVDHIVPLQGKSVCGLHVHYNLQYLTAEENKRKSNRHGS